LDSKIALLGVFVVLSLVFGTLSMIEYGEINAPEMSRTTTTQLALQFPHSQSEIDPFCSQGLPVSSGWETMSYNATGQITRRDFFTPVMAMPHASTAYACVTYQSVTGSALDNFPTKTMNFSLSAEICNPIQSNSSYNGLALRCSKSSSVVGNAFPAEVELTNSTGAFTVVYSMTSRLAGFYAIAGDAFWGYPLSVGYPTPEVNATDFYLHIEVGGNPTLSAPIQVVSVRLIGTSAVYVDFACLGPFLHLQCIPGD
jgi:hypothetical protein